MLTKDLRANLRCITCIVPVLLSNTQLLWTLPLTSVRIPQSARGTENRSIETMAARPHFATGNVAAKQPGALRDQALGNVSSARGGKQNAILRRSPLGKMGKFNLGIHFCKFISLLKTSNNAATIEKSPLQNRVKRACGCKTIVASPSLAMWLERRGALVLTVEISLKQCFCGRKGAFFAAIRSEQTSGSVGIRCVSHFFSTFVNFLTRY